MFFKKSNRNSICAEHNIGTVSKNYLVFSLILQRNAITACYTGQEKLAKQILLFCQLTGDLYETRECHVT